MRVNGKWIDWKDQCDLCMNAENCKSKNPIYGNIEFICDYFYLDENKYKANEIYGTSEHCYG